MYLVSAWLLALLGAIPAARGEEGEITGQVIYETLDNGLAVVVLPVDSPGVAAVQTWMDVGSRHEVDVPVEGSAEGPGITGYAHFFEHLMFHGSEALPSREREDRLLELGVEENAWTSDDNTCYHLVLPAEHLGEVLRIEADRFAHLHLVESEVRREAGAVLGELRKGRADPEEILEETLYATAFSEHTYHHTPIGLRADVEAMPEGTEAARRFYRTWYRPERATLVVTGDVDPERVLDLVKSTHGGWQVPEIELPEPVDEPPQEAERRAHVGWDAGETNPRLAIGWKVGAYTAGEPDSAVLDVLSELLGSAVAPLYWRLVIDEQLAWAVDCPAPHRVDPGLFVVRVELRPEADLDVVEDAVYDAITDLSQGAADATVRAAAERLRRTTLLSLDSPQAWAYTLGSWSSLGGSPDALDRWLAALAEVDAQDIHRVLERDFSAERRTVITLAGGEG